MRDFSSRRNNSHQIVQRKVSRNRIILYQRDFVLLTLLMLIIVLYAFRLQLIVDHSYDGINLDKVQAQTHELDTQNIVLRTQVLNARSLTTIAQKAKQMGFVERR